MCRMIVQKCKGNLGKTLCIVMLLGIVFYGLTLSQLNAQKRGNLLSVRIDVPQAGQLPKTRNPGHVLSLLKIQQLLLDVAQNPKDHPFIEESLKEIGISAESFPDEVDLKNIKNKYLCVTMSKGRSGRNEKNIF